MIHEHQHRATAIPQLLSRTEAAARLGVSVQTLERYVRAGVVPAIKFGPHMQSRVRFNSEAVDQALVNLTTGR